MNRPTSTPRAAARFRLNRYNPEGTPADVNYIVSALEDSLDDDKMFAALEESMDKGAKLGSSSVPDAKPLPRAARAVIVTNRARTLGSVKPTLINRMRLALGKALQGAKEGDGPRVVLKTLRRQMQIMKRHATEISAQEVSASYSEARAQSLTQTNPTFKKWLTRRDQFVRPSHRLMDDEEAPWNALFSNGMARPLDPSAPAGEVINCRCKLVPVYRKAGIEELL